MSVFSKPISPYHFEDIDQRSHAPSSSEHMSGVPPTNYYSSHGTRSYSYPPYPNAPHHSLLGIPNDPHGPGSTKCLILYAESEKLRHKINELRNSMYAHVFFFFHYAYAINKFKLSSNIQNNILNGFRDTINGTREDVQKIANGRTTCPTSEIPNISSPRIPLNPREGDYSLTLGARGPGNQ